MSEPRSKPEPSADDGGDAPTSVRMRPDTDAGAVPLGAPATEDIALDLADIEEVSISEGKRVSLATLNKLAPVGRFGKYHLLGRLAYGGMAEIFLAREVQVDGGESRLGRFCVVKRVLPHVATDRQFTSMFIDEARLVVQLSHPSICHVYAYGEEEGAYFIAMEWVNGMTLSRTLRRAKKMGGLALPLSVKIVSMVAEALDHAHRAVDQTTGEPLGIVHRDVSPQNVMVAFDGVVKLLDFGIAKATSHSTRTEAGVVKGKFAYMSPQQCVGEPIDARSDVFALGVVLYELIDGENPFKKQTEFDTMRACVYDDPPPLVEKHAHVPSDVSAIVQKALEKKPENRFQSASEMQLALERALARMGEIVTSAHIATRMHEIFEADIKAGPRLDTRIDGRRDATGTSELEARAMTPSLNGTARLERPRESMASVPTAVPVPPRSRVASALGLVLVLVFGAASGAALLSFLRPTPEAPVVPTTVVATHEAPPPPTVAPVPTGTLYLDSDPPGAAIVLGTRGEVGRTPLEVALLPPGEWPITLRLEGYAPYEQSVTLAAGERRDVRAPLVAAAIAPTADDEHRHHRRPDEAPVVAPPPPPPAEPARPMGHLSINTRPWSRVYVGSRLLGTTPIGRAEVPSGTVRLHLVDRDGAEHDRTITVAETGETREFFDLSSEASPAP